MSSAIKEIVNTQYEYLSEGDRGLITYLATHYFNKEQEQTEKVARECIKDACVYLEYYIEF